MAEAQENSSPIAPGQISALDTARALVAAGISVCPIGANKRPAIASWKPYTGRLPTDADLSAWFGAGSSNGIGRVGGAVSGNLETIDFDAPNSEALLTAWRAIVDAQAPGLVDRLSIIRTPR